jgi:hypothetical protein
VILLFTGMTQRWVRVTRASQASMQTPLRQPLSQIPANIGTYRLRGEIPLDTDVLRAANVDHYVNRVYEDSVTGHQVFLYVGYWGTEAAGMGHGPDVCYPAVGWRSEGEPSGRAVRSGSGLDRFGATIMLHRFSHAEPEGIARRCVGFVAVVSGEFVGSSRGMFWHTPRRDGHEGGHYLAQVQVASAVPDEKWENAESEIVSFMEALLPHTAECLP